MPKTGHAVAIARGDSHAKSASAHPERTRENPKLDTPTNPKPLRVLLTVEDAAQQLSIGRTTMYALIKTGEIATVRIGHLRRVPADAVSAYVSQLTEQQAA